MNRTYSARAGTSRAGITKVELLVVVLLILGGVALLLPAINKARVTSAFSQCEYNAQILADGVLRFVANSNAFPNACFDSVAAPQSPSAAATVMTKQIAASTDLATRARYSWVVRILPHIEQGSTYDHLVATSKQFTIPAFDPLNTVSSGKHLIATQGIRFTRCPSADTEYYATAPEYQPFIRKDPNTNETIGIATCNYVAMSDTDYELIADQPAQATGIIIPEGTVREENLTRGAGQTILFAESKEPGYSSWYDAGSGWMVAVPPELAKTGAEFTSLVEKQKNTQLLNYGPAPDHPDRVYLPQADWSNQHPRRWGASSNHVGGVMHAFADGNVEIIATDIDPKIYRSLADRNGPPGNPSQ